MNGRVGQMRCGYQVVGDRAGASALAARLDRLATTQVPDVMAEALNQALGDDATVYVVRRVESHVLLGGKRQRSDAQLARAWGARLAQDVLKELAANPLGGADVVRFADTAEYVGSFVAEMLRGRAWDQWYYRRFSPLRSLGAVGALRAVLTEHAEHLPAIVRTVHRRDALEHLLAISDEEMLALLWQGVPELVGRGSDRDAETARPVFLAVVRLVDHLDAWTDPRPDTTSLWQAYLATEPLPTSWRDGRDLSATFVDILQLLHDLGHLQPVDVQHAVTRHDTAIAELARTRLDTAIAELDWLDATTLRPAIERLLLVSSERPPDDTQRDTATAHRVFLAVVRLIDHLDAWTDPRPDTTSLWDTYLATQPPPTTGRDPTGTFVDILHLLYDLGHVRPDDTQLTEIHLDPPVADLDGAAQTRLDTVLADLDGVDTAVIRSSLERLVRATPTRSPALPVLDRSRRRTPRQREVLADLDALLNTGAVRLATGPLDTTANAIRLHAALVAAAPRWQDDTMAKRMIERLLTTAQRLRNGDIHTRAVDEEQSAVVMALAADESDVETIGTACAGVFLLVRAALDARLPALVTRVEYPRVSDVLLALALRWAGPAGVVDDHIDRGLALLGDIDSREELRARWRTVPEERHASWIQALSLDDDVPTDTDVLRDGQLDLPSVDAVVGMTALGLLRWWAQWLRGFSSSSTPYLLDQFIRRPGRVERRADDLLVILKPRPLDVVLQLAGYLDTLDLTPLWGHGRLRFKMVET